MGQVELGCKLEKPYAHLCPQRWLDRLVRIACH